MHTARAHTSDSGVAIRVDRHVEAQLPGRGRMTDAIGKMMAERKTCQSRILGIALFVMANTPVARPMRNPLARPIWMGGRMVTSESYKQLSDRCAQLAIASSAPGIAQALMATALGS
jgi:hypothetical protein